MKIDHPNDGAIFDEQKKFIKANLTHWLSFLQDLIRTPSFFEAEHSIIKLVSDYIEDLGLPVQRVEHTAERLRSLPAAQPPFSEVPGRCSLVTQLKGKDQGQSLILNTHLDIVFEGDSTAWTYPPFSGYIDETKKIIYGRGAMDDKGGVIISLAILEILCKTSIELAGDVIFHYVLEDETTGNGSLLCLEAGYGADAALIIDGTRTDKAINQHVGQMQVDIKVKGRPASVGVSHLGINAAEMMARLLLHLREAIFALNEQRLEPWTHFPNPYQFVIQHLHSDGAQLTVPELATARCYLTFPPPFTLAKMRHFLQQQVEIFARANQLPNLPTLNWDGFAAEPVQADNIYALEQILQATASRQGMSPIEVGPSTGSSDLRHFVVAGIPCLLYGPGTGFNPHRPDEHYYLDDLPKMILFYLDLVHTWCGSNTRL